MASLFLFLPVSVSVSVPCLTREGGRRLYGEFY